MSCGNNCAGCSCDSAAPSEEELEAYFSGIAAGISMYAWWKDGEQFVGTTGKLLSTALEELRSERIKVLEQWHINKKVN